MIFAVISSVILNHSFIDIPQGLRKRSHGGDTGGMGAANLSSQGSMILIKIDSSLHANTLPEDEWYSVNEL